MDIKDIDSRLSGFYNLTPDMRRKLAAQHASLSSEDLSGLTAQGSLSLEQADLMIENTIGLMAMPFGIAVYFRVNQRDVLVPMVIEEPSVVAGASFMAKLARKGGGFEASSTEPVMIGQIQLLDLPDLQAAENLLLEYKERILDQANRCDSTLQRLGGGARDLQIRRFPESPVGPMLIVHLLYDVRDAMGANSINTALESIAPDIEAITGGRVHLRILSNLADQRLARASCRIPVDTLAFNTYRGEQVRDGIIEAWAFAEVDSYRAATHNKGIMNGIDAVVLATGNDWRAVEAGAHAYAARSGRYSSLSRWWKEEDGSLAGSLELPLALGIIGGATRVNPAAKAALALLQVKTARELAEITAAVGLAQNLAALRALATEGIQRGHMSLHARQIAVAVGAPAQAAARIASQMVAEQNLTPERAQQLLESWKPSASENPKNNRQENNPSENSQTLEK
ncbi:MAG: hydroxymethylglutaryl-CoA reductase, degradative [Anaerolineales bacterium]|nr:hydroxymethylglutaryl-CoA reductase, degradative [Anaerolineales bacterium]